MCTAENATRCTTISSSLVPHVATELEQLKAIEEGPFPITCRRFLRSLPGNSHCADCSQTNPTWASITYGSLYCLQCSGRHRSYGVNTSVIRSIELDHWTSAQVLSLLEGGNGQLEQFLDRHSLGRRSAMAESRYFTKAAQFYKVHLRQHVSLLMGHPYRGRDASRKLATAAQNKKHEEKLKVVKGSTDTTSRREELSLQPIEVR